MTNKAKLWGGRFADATAGSVEAFTASIHYDVRLFHSDIAGSRAHARMLERQGLLTQDEINLILQGLDEIEAEIEAGDFAFKAELEDIHMNIEAALIDRVGDAGRKLHTARSRNDQIALDIRLYLRDEAGRFNDLLLDVQRSLIELARKNDQVLMPGYTHLQRAQPVLVAHHLLAYFEMFRRDRDRLADCRRRLNVMPLGCAALAGTGLPIDREFVARELGFPEVTANSMDTVGDRDFVVEFVSCLALIQIHLSRMSEELVLWASSEFSFITIADSFCTGSSIMPQKKNPDIPELIRGKTGRVVGSLMALLTLLKGLPLTYNRDLQEDKEPLFDAIDTVSACLAITAELLQQIEFNAQKLSAALTGGFMTATDLADYLVGRKMPFREAHGVVGRIVAHCAKAGKELTDLTLTELRSFSELIEGEVFAVLTPEGSVNSRMSTGGTAYEQVRAALNRAENNL